MKKTKLRSSIDLKTRLGVTGALLGATLTGAALTGATGQPRCQIGVDAFGQGQ